MSMLTLTVANQKGGTGKTTTALHLARAGVVAGRRVLLVDADPQGNATKSACGGPIERGAPGLADVLSPRVGASIEEVCVPSPRWEGLTVLPSSGPILAAVRDELTVMPLGREMRLKAALEAVAGDYDLVLIDCAPSIDSLTVNAFVAAKGLVVVTEAEEYAADGLGELLDTVSTVQSYYNPALNLVGIVVNAYAGRTTEERAHLEGLRAEAGERSWPLLEPPVRYLARIGEAGRKGAGLDESRDATARYFGTVYGDYLTQIEGALR